MQSTIRYGKRVLGYLNQNYKEIALTNIGACLTTYLVTTRIFTFASVTGESMAPTFKARTLAVVDLFTPVTKLKQKDIVLCHDPEQPGNYIVKRIGGLAGQFVEIVAEYPGQYVDKKAHDGKLSVPTGYCWIEGDNKVKSHDSREYGPIPLGLVIGRVLFKI